jgi:uncharacterized membrane protein YdjX (TVP38/TMEM64 family)
MNKESFKWYKQGLGTVVFCILIAYFFAHADMVSTFNQTWIDSDIRDNGLKGALYFFGISVVITACGAPRQIVAFLGGYAFGAVFGVILATAATLVGCITTFYVSKMMIKPLVRKKFHKHSLRIDTFLTDHPIRKTIIIRLLPVGSNVLTNLIAGTTNVSPRAFFIGSCIGYIPQMFIFSLLGKGMLIGSEWKIISSILLLLISSYLSFSLYKKHRSSLEATTSKTPGIVE